MNILFVCSSQDVQSERKPLRTQEQMQFGVSYISSFLKQHNHNTKLLILSKLSHTKGKTILDEYIQDFRPQLICFTAVSTEYDFIAEIASYIKSDHPDIYLFVGGCHVSLNPEEAISSDFDALCIGEGEYPTLELAAQLEQGSLPSGIPNLWIKNNLGIQKNQPRPFLQDLDSLPFPIEIYGNHG